MTVSNTGGCFCVRAPCFLPARRVLNTVRATTLTKMSVQLVLPRRTSGHIARLNSYSCLTSMLHTKIGICFCGGNFLRSGLVISSSVLSAIKSAGLSFHDFRRGFRMGTFVCSVRATLRVQRVFLRSRQRDARVFLGD